jgi:hypothetical protein
MKLNKAQREGIAKVLDNIATACSASAIIGGWVDHKTSWGAFLFLTFSALLLASIAMYIRKEIQS